MLDRRLKKNELLVTRFWITVQIFERQTWTECSLRPCVSRRPPWTRSLKKCSLS